MTKLTLQEQMLKAGLVTSKKVAKVQRTATQSGMPIVASLPSSRLSTPETSDYFYCSGKSEVSGIFSQKSRDSPRFLEITCLYSHKIMRASQP